jgi:DUF1009 family protein
MTAEPGARAAGSGPLGILAGGGVLPLEVAAAVEKAGRPVHIVGIDGFAPSEIERYSHCWVNLGQIGGMIRGFRRAGCGEIVIAGAMRRPNLLKLKPDWGSIRSISTVLRLTRGGDDSVLRRIVRFFELQGFGVCGVHEVAPHLLAPQGVLGKVAPSEGALCAIARGADVIDALGRFDVGQAVVVTEQAIVALEGARGTDAMLQDVASAFPEGSGAARPGVLVKLPKPGQELRIDLPAIGPGTIELCAAASVRGVAIRAGQSLLLERQETMARADAAGVFVVGLPPAIGRGAPPAAGTGDGRVLSVLGRRAPTPAERRDIALGRTLLQVLAGHQAGDAAVVADDHVLAIDAALSIRALANGLAGGSHWGRRVFRKRIGVLVVRRPDIVMPLDADPEAEAAVDFGWIAEAGLAGIACVEGSIPKDLVRAAAAQADTVGLFLMAVGSGP